MSTEPKTVDDTDRAKRADAYVPQAALYMTAASVTSARQVTTDSFGPGTGLHRENALR